MGVLRHRHPHHHNRRLSFATVTALAFLLFVSASATRLRTTRQLGEKTKIRTSTESEVSWRVLSQNRLGGPGSSPPTCRSKCGRCSPCRPVQVPIEPGLSIPLEYYPEAWRCKCSNMLFMP